MDSPGILRLAWGLPLLLAGWLVPGAALLRAVGWRFDPGLAFGFSCVLLYNAVLASNLFLGRISLGAVTTLLAGFSVAAWFVARPARTAAPFPSLTPVLTTSSRRFGSPWLIAPLAVIALSAAFFTWRAFAFPLSGPDTPFRWNLLPHLMLDLGNLSYYPPVTDTDFSRYFFFDGFAPLLAVQYWWTYAALGSTNAMWTGFAVAGQFIAILWLVGRAVARLTDFTTGVMAAGLLALTPLLFWAVALGQESGLTALCVAAIAATWAVAREESRWSALIPVAVATQLGAVAREYGFVFVVIGALVGAALAVPVKRLLHYVALSVTLAAPWYLHVWLKTGNPFFSLSLGGLFPVSTHVTDFWAACATVASPANYTAAEARGYAWQVFLYAPLLWLGLLAVAFAAFRPFRVLLAGCLLLVALWFSSIAYTAGGFMISLRVLAPAVVLGALVVGLWLHRSQLSRDHWRHWLVAGLAAIVTLVLGSRAEHDPWKLHARWRARDDSPWRFTRQPIARTVTPTEGFLVTDNAYLHAYLLLTAAPRQAVPPWSPGLSFLFDRSLSPAEIHRRLRALDVRVVSDPQPGANTAYLGGVPFFHHELPRLPQVPLAPGTTGRLLPAALVP